MQTKDREAISFLPKVGIGTVLFTDLYSTLEEKLGTPDQCEIGEIFDADFTVNVIYDRINCNFYFHYENLEYTYMSVHTKRIVLDSFDFHGEKKESILNKIHEYHVNNNIELKEDYTFDKNVNEECFEYDNLGFTIWFANSEISDIALIPY